MNILVIDVGGSHVKLWYTDSEERRKFKSGKQLTPDRLVHEAKGLIEDWPYSAIAMGLPGRVSRGRVVDDPANLGAGYVGYNFAAAFGKEVRLMNDACLQALGSYDGGRMLFLSLGTAIGAALVMEKVIVSLDLGQLRLGGKPLFKRLGDAGLERAGVKKWSKFIHKVVPALGRSMMADYVVLGGGNVDELKELPEGARRGNNRAVLEGGRRLWEELPDPAAETCNTWVIR